MVRFVVVPDAAPTDWPEETLTTLRASPVRFLADAQESDFKRMEAAGLSCVPLPSELATDVDCVVVRCTKSARADLPLYRLAYVVDRLLGPGGCPWDQEQTHETLKRHMLEEAYEVLDAIDSASTAKLQEELGDLLMQPFMHAQMEKLQGNFDIDDVARGIVDKLIRRHPHVFGDRDVADADEVLRNWDQIKQTEKGGEPESLLAGVPKGMASLLRAYEISKRAARVGFEWPDIEAVFDKLREEEAEFREALASENREHAEAELGDMLFTVVNLGRWAGVEPEEALRKMLNRFTERFMAMERNAPCPLRELGPEEWDALWERSKAESRS